MNLAQAVRRRVDSRSPLELFSPDVVAKRDESHLAIAKELSRLQADGEIIRARKGVYYKPKKSRFGVLKPSESDIIKFLLFEKGKRIGYISGLRLYNRLGLTSQVSGVVEIACKFERRSGEFMGLRVRYIKSYSDVKKDDIQLLEILDAIKDSNRIPDASQIVVIRSLFNLIQNLSPKKQVELAKIAMKYPPRVKAIIGAMIALLNPERKEDMFVLKALRSQIPNTSQYEFKMIGSLLPNSSNWELHGTT